MVWLSVAITATAALLLMPMLMRAAVRLDLLDRPGGRKEHLGAVPLVGVNGDQVSWLSQIHWFSPLTGVWFNGLQWFRALACSFCVTCAGSGLAF